MKKFVLNSLVIGIALFYSLAVCGGTLIYEDRSIKTKDPKARLRQISKVKIVSISDNMVIIEKDGATRRIPLRMLKEYYDTDLKDGATGDFDDNSAEYTVEILDIDHPQRGYKKATGKNRHRHVTTRFVIKYHIMKQDKNHKTQRIRRPYFYLYVYTSGPNEYHNRNIFKFYYPKMAKVKNTVYNRAEIMSAVSSFKRTIINLDDAYNRDYYSNHHKLSTVGGDRQVRIEMKGIKYRRILAYHLEVWGKNDIVAEKNWSEPGIRLGKKWWVR